ncbi:MAG: hypothetical protein QOK51_10235 [Nitrososphaeraceae archaeon]|nr:hypothetical protein [Nitrososphaeraceae archaeon]
MISITNRPVLIYDDRCSSCTIFAKYAFKYSRGQINCIGHYSKEGEKLRKIVFPPNYNETEMFWMITPNVAYGGRSGLSPLLELLIKSIFKPNKSSNSNFARYCSDNKSCSDKKFQIKRLYNLLKHGKKLNIKCTKTIND